MGTIKQQRHKSGISIVDDTNTTADDKNAKKNTPYRLPVQTKAFVHPTYVNPVSFDSSVGSVPVRFVLDRDR